MSQCGIVYGYLEQRLFNVPPNQLLVEVTEFGTESREISLLCSVVLLRKRSFMAILRVCLAKTRRHFMFPYKY
jgi:hypothetical protein